MADRVLKGEEVAREMQRDLTHRVVALGAKGIEPLLSIVFIGHAASARAYIKGIERTAMAIGVKVHTRNFPPDVKFAVLKEHLQALNEEAKVHGVVIMRPLPPGIEEDTLGKILMAQKDVDCFGTVNAGKFMAGDKEAFPPATPQAVMEILKHYKIPLRGRRAVVIGRSMVVGKPLAMLFLKEDATVSICHSHTKDLAGLCRQADILVSAAGHRGLVGKEMIKPGAVVIDVGINYAQGKIWGDVDYEAVYPIAGAITPVPGGVGTVTSRVLLKHVVQAAEGAAAI
ncbi:MAG: bifunctional 5,10-methylenetetrahydrofolate dehydrogenase/5,10-methenyltetrahydrofolate cyclohydrolase [Firmicutes bacterium]|nr:bifunctional 5,10-methylenetetrahydrofolate dehydrogenase/5,10-methenyltetrahydrofolate cyclohydrolase [Bacillota bacterium]